MGLSAARPPAQRRRSGLLGTVGGLRVPGLHGVHPEEAAAALLQGEVRGAGGRAGRHPGALLRAAADSGAAEPRVGRASPGSSGREGRAVPPPARRPARLPSRLLPADPRRPAADLRERLLGKRGRRGGRGQPRPREEVDRAPTSLRSHPLTGKQAHFRPECPSQGVFVTHAPAGDPDVVPAGMRATLGFFFGITGLASGSRDRTVTLSLSGSGKAGYARKCRCSFYSGWLYRVFTCSY